jgi:hypothetical protein
MPIPREMRSPDHVHPAEWPPLIARQLAGMSPQPLSLNSTNLKKC